MLLRTCSTSLAWHSPQLMCGHAQVARIDEADELRRLVVKQRVRAHRIGRGGPGVGKARMDVGHVFGRGRRDRRRGNRLQPSLTVSLSCMSPTSWWHWTQPQLLASASARAFACRDRGRCGAWAAELRTACGCGGWATAAESASVAVGAAASLRGYAASCRIAARKRRMSHRRSAIGPSGLRRGSCNVERTSHDCDIAGGVCRTLACCGGTRPVRDVKIGHAICEGQHRFAVNISTSAPLARNSRTACPRRRRSGCTGP